MSEDEYTMSVVEAGRRLGLARNASYDAASRGDIPVIKIGKRLRVPIKAFEKMLDVNPIQEVDITAKDVDRASSEAIAAVLAQIWRRGDDLSRKFIAAAIWGDRNAHQR